MFFNHQKTIRNKVSCSGIALHSGSHVKVTLCPAPVDTGIVFRRTDIAGEEGMLVSSFLNVSRCDLCTTISKGKNEISTIEHLMAAFWGLGIDNIYIDINGDEVPIMDGSAEPFVFLIECAGVVEQHKPRKYIEIMKKVSIDNGKSAVEIEPSNSFRVSVNIDFNNDSISKQSYNFDINNFFFKNDIARARTFGFESEVEYLRSIGLARGGALSNAVVVGDSGILNEEGLRYRNEFVRHKILDSIGDLYLAGPIIGHFTGDCSGHALNNKLLRKLFEDKTAWREVELPEAR